MQASLSEITGRLGGELIGDAALVVTRIAPLAAADASSISFLSHPRYVSQLADCRAACVIVSPAVRDPAAARGAAIVVDDPYLYYARLTQWWAAASLPPAEPGVHASAVVEPGAIIAASASVGAFVFVAAGARVGAHAVIGTHASIGRDAALGEGTRLAPRVTIAGGCRIGARGIVHSGVVIGADGFGFARDLSPLAASPPSPEGSESLGEAGSTRGRWVKIEQLGSVTIGDDVEIGANTCIDRGALDDTVIEDGVKLDNLVQIGHNVRVGAHSAFAGCVGVAGSATIGQHCTAGGGAIILGHLRLVDHVHLSAATVVTRSILKPGQYSGVFPFDDNASWERNAATLRNLYSLRERLRALEKKT